MHRLHTAFIVAVAVLGLAGCSSQSGDGARTPSASAASSLNRIGTPLDSAIPRHIRNLTFTDSNGRKVRLDDLEGRTVVLSDVMTLCQETCPIDTATVVQTARAEEHPAQGKPPVFISLTVDPARDTTAQLTAYRRLFTDPPSNWQAWTGSSKNVNALWDYFGVWRKRVADDPGPAPHNWRTGKPLTYDIQHSDEVFFIDATGHERFVLEGAPYAPGGTVPKALRAFMNKEGHKNLASPPATAWTKAQAETVLRSLRS
ncbi:MAG TPA: SCO family protein [Flexivirga sp.]|uniref:SCO family protein n=1 Tax=Flexivirga sp. TaxID=1962927 RepID=UPI002BC948FF|nr:SCO family protein [Flexivirga sp.]HWC22775.1 SCO family protein [Flexivirga sp.]